MNLTKEVKVLLPTVQYGNVTITIGMTDTFDTPEDPTEKLKRINLAGKILDKAIQMEYNKTYKMLSEDTDKLTRLDN